MNEWAAEIQRDVYEFWKEEYPEYPHGFNVFLSPVQYNPELLIVGFQPGGNQSNFESFAHKFRSGDFSPPSQHEFLESSYPLARVMRNKVFANSHPLLKNSVALNAVFFLSPSKDTWDNLPDDQRDDMESFCFNHLDNIIEELSPDNILFLGIETWEKMALRYGFEIGEEVLRPSTEDDYRLVLISNSESPRYMAVCHPTGARGLKDNELEKAETIINRYLV
jgi:hypothetical protein